MKTRSLALIGLFIVLEVVFTRFISINTQVIRMGFTFIPMAVAGLVFGPIKGGLIAVAADIIGATLWPQGAYFFGFTVSAFLSGASYGLLRGKKDIFPWLVAVSVFNTVVVNLGLNTVWLEMMLGKSWTLLLPPRILKSLISLPIEVYLLRTVIRLLQNNLKERLLV